jgi:hypothetical protein
MLMDIPRVTLDEFEIVPTLTNDCLVLQLSGTGDVVAVAPLRDCLQRVGNKIRAKQLFTVEVDIRHLVLLNSSCLKQFASFLLELSTTKTPCSVCFVVDAKLAWQSRSLFALERLAGDIVCVASR